MQTVYYSLMLKLLAFLVWISFVGMQGSQRQWMPRTWGVLRPYGSSQSVQAGKALHEPFSDAHEGIAIGVDPWTTANRYKEKFTKKSPLTGGVVAFRISFRNDNEKGVRVSLQRIRLIVQIDEDNRQELQALGPDDVADTVLLKPARKDPTSHRSPLPIPIPSTGPKGRDANWVKLRDECQNAGMPSGVIGAHETVAGLLYFDMRGEVDLVKLSKLYVPNLVMMDSNEPISYFEIELGRGAAN